MVFLLSALQLPCDEVRERVSHSGADGSAHSLDLLITLASALSLRLGGFLILLARKYNSGSGRSLLGGPLLCREPPLRQVYAKPRNETPKNAENEQGWEGLPIVSTRTDYRLYHIRPNN